MPQSTQISGDHPATFSRLSKTTTIVVVCAAIAKYRGLQLPYGLRYTWLVLLLLHWKNLPTIWHWITFSPLFSVLLRRWSSWWGLYKPNQGERAQELGFPKEDWYIGSIGISPFSQDAIVKTSYYVGIADSDFNLHLSNSVYSRNLDHARMEISMTMFGQLFRVKGFNALLGGVSLMFLKEIPMFTRYQVETMLVAWNDRWFFELHRFSLPLSHKKGRDTVIKTSTGDRVLCTLALSKITCKVGRDLVVPDRAVAYCAFGRDGSNWVRTKSLQKKGDKAAKAFLKGEGEEDLHLEDYRDQNKKALAIIDRLGGHEVKSVWLELATVHQAQR